MAAPSSRRLASSVFVRLAGVSGASAVGLGAYGAHGKNYFFLYR